MIEQASILILAAALLLGSPGPAPLALAASGASFGVRTSLPFLFGILLGLIGVIFGTIFGAALLLDNWPRLRLFVQIISGAYIAYIAFKIANSPINSAYSADKNKPDSIQAAPTVLDGFIFNLINPKAYAAFFALFAQFGMVLDSPFNSFLFTAITCFAVACVVDLAWLLIGRTLRGIFTHKFWGRPIRVIFAALMLLTLLSAFLFPSNQ